MSQKDNATEALKSGDTITDKKPSSGGDSGGRAADWLRSFIERVERLEEEKKALLDDIKEVYSEAKGTGFDVKIMRKIVRLRKMDAADRQEQAEIFDLYAQVLELV